ncbi:glycosyltransferase family 39 protein [Candidatus Microgenomates bacterium]|nr:glycosyltransferase family 39 protein [Candidatus Microgenomates bacterium]
MITWLLTKTPFLFLTQSIWRDEAFSYLTAKQPFFHIFSLTARDFNPPLYYLLLHIYMWIFGHSEIMLRTFSLIFFNVTIYTACQILEHIFGKKSQSRWIYLLLFAFNPFLVYYALEARMYAMTACLTTLSWYFLLSRRPRKYLLTVVCGLLTHYFFLFVLAAQITYMLLSRTHTKEQKRLYIKHLVPAGVVFGTWVFYVLSQHPPVGKAFWIIPPTLYTILNTPAVLLTGYEDIFTFPHFSLVPYTVLFIATLVLGYKTATRTKHDRDVMLMLACWTTIPVILTLVLTPIKPLFLPRYLMISTPGILLMILFLIARMPTRQIRVIFLAFFFIAFASYHSLQITFRKKADFRSVMHEITTLSKPGDSVYVENELNLHPAQYYFDPSRVYIIGKSYDEIPDYVGKVLIPPDRIVSTPPRFPNKAFILHDNLSYSIQSIF